MSKEFQINGKFKGFHYMPAVHDKRMPMELWVKIGTTDIDKALDTNSDRYMMFDLAAKLHVEGIAEGVPARGFAFVDHIDDKIQLQMQFFVAEEGYMLTAEKLNINWLKTFTGLGDSQYYVTIVNGADQLISRGSVNIDIKEVLKLAKNFILSYKK